MVPLIPQKSDFDKARLSEKRSKWSRYIAAVISLASVILSMAHLNYSVANNSVVALTLLAEIAAFYFQWQFELSYRKAEETRRDGLVDDSFSTKLADIPSEGYYDTEDIEHGVKKLLSNIHENSLFSAKVVYAMFKKTEIKTLFLIASILIIAVFNFFGLQFAVTVVDVFLSLDFLRDYLKLRKLQDDLEDVLTSCKNIWEHYSSKHGKAEMKTTAEIIRVVIRYETSLAYASLMFDSDIFEQIKTSTNAEWENIKKRFCMNL